MNFTEIFQSSFLENFTGVSLLDMTLALTLAFCLGLFILFVYQRTCTGVLYSSGFGVSLVALTMITALVILAVTSNVVLSLGMVGALSIVRFRTAIKEPLEITFLFWSIAVGIVLAAGLIPLAVLGSVFIGVVLLVFVNRKPHRAPYIAVLRCADADAAARAEDFLKQHTLRCATKSKTVSAAGVEVDFDIRLREENTAFIDRLARLEGVESAVLVSYNGDYMG